MHNQGLSEDNKKKIAAKLATDYRIEGHEVMQKLRSTIEGEAVYWDIIEIVGANLSVEQIAANSAAQNQWLLRTLQVLSLDHLLQFLRNAINQGDSDLGILAVARLSAVDPLQIVQKARSIRFLLKEALRTLGAIELDSDIQNLLILTESGVDIKMANGKSR